jgi:hypothetical protein
MKKLIMLSLLLQILIAPVAIYATAQGTLDPRNLPEFTGSITDPEVTVVNDATDYIVVYYKGKYYIIKK